MKLWSPAAIIYIRRDLSLVTLVSEEDYPFLAQWAWGLQVDNRGKNYVRRYRGSSNIYLHRVIMRRIGKAPSPAHRYVDHINNDGLDNRRENLRWATASENARNTPRLLGGVNVGADTVNVGRALRDLRVRREGNAQAMRDAIRVPSLSSAPTPDST